jgi:hypothetical protein
MDCLSFVRTTTVPSYDANLEYIKIWKIQTELFETSLKMVKLEIHSMSYWTGKRYTSNPNVQEASIQTIWNVQEARLDDNPDRTRGQAKDNLQCTGGQGRNNLHVDIQEARIQTIRNVLEARLKTICNVQKAKVETIYM